MRQFLPRRRQAPVATTHRVLRRLAFLRSGAAVALTAVALTCFLSADAALGAPSAFDPQGGRWPRSEGSTNNYFAGMSEKSVPTRQAIRVWQELLNEHGADLPVTGHFGPLTAKAVRDFQAANDLDKTGRINYVTARALLARTIRREAKSAGIPASILCGHLAHESVLDPGAVGATGEDLGIGQVVLRFVPELTTTTVWDEDSAIRYMARRDAAAKRAYGSWEIAIVHYNSPLRAKQWHDAGRPTSSLASSYSKKALAGCGTLPETKSFGLALAAAKKENAKEKAEESEKETAQSGSKIGAPAPSSPATGVADAADASEGPDQTPVTAEPSTSAPAAEQSVQRLLLAPVSAVSALSTDDVASWRGGVALGLAGVFVLLWFRRRRAKALRIYRLESARRMRPDLPPAAAPGPVAPPPWLDGYGDGRRHDYSGLAPIGTPARRPQRSDLPTRVPLTAMGTSHARPAGPRSRGGRHRAVNSR